MDELLAGNSCTLSFSFINSLNVETIGWFSFSDGFALNSQIVFLVYKTQEDYERAKSKTAWNDRSRKADRTICNGWLTDCISPKVMAGMKRQHYYRKERSFYKCEIQKKKTKS